jgi:hypothetical protein
MLKVKIVSVLFIMTIAGTFLVANTVNQIPPNKNQSKSESATVEKAPIKCSVEAYQHGLASDEPKTSIIRAAPKKNSAIVKTIKTADEIVFSISGSDGKGWFEISKIEAVSDEEKTLFAGRGWVHSSLLDLSVAASDPKLHSAPNKRSRIIKKLVPDASEARPLACQGEWMKVKSGKTTGWLSREGQCANPLTTCS